MQSDAIQSAFAGLRTEPSAIERQYNSERRNLHFESLPLIDEELFPTLLDLATRSRNKAKEHHDYFLAHALSMTACSGMTFPF